MKFRHLVIIAATFCLIACSSGSRSEVARLANHPVPTPKPTPAAQNSFPLVHVFVALCDNVNQGIVPVAPSLGNGEDAAQNLYWGASFGVKSFFKRDKNWELVAEIRNPSPVILERVIFQDKTRNVVMIADAYRGKEIKQATLDFLAAAAGAPGEEIRLPHRNDAVATINPAGSADVVAYIGHDGFMDFALPETPQKRDNRKRDAIILACASKQYFALALERTGASPLVWTTNLMAPEAYVLSAALEGWIKKESAEEIRMRAAKAYHSYQNCGLKAASKLFATGW